MTGREFVAMWAAVIGFTAFVVGWALLCSFVLFPHSPPAVTVTAGVGPIVVILIVGTWLAVRS